MCLGVWGGEGWRGSGGTLGMQELCAQVETRHEKAELPRQTDCHITTWKIDLKYHTFYVCKYVCMYACIYLFTYLRIYFHLVGAFYLTHN